MPIEEAAPEKGTALDSKAPAAGTGETTPEKGTAPASQGGAAPALPHGWMAGLTPEQKTNADLVKGLSAFEKGLPDLVRYYADAESAKGKTTAVPGEKATPEEMAAFRKAVGVPEKSEDYKLEKITLPDGKEADPEWEKELKELAHKANVSQGQLSSIHKWYFTKLAGEMKIVKTTMDEALQTMRKKLGSRYDLWNTHKTRAFEKFGDPELAALFETTGLGNHPRMLKMFGDIGEALSEHVFAQGDRGGKPESSGFGKRSEEELAANLYPSAAK